MNELTFTGLLNNAALLMVLGLIYDMLPLRMRTQIRTKEDVGSGILLGLIGCAVMFNAWQMSPGVIIDTRSVLLSVSGLFFGSVSTLIAMVITALMRIYQGGAGALTGVLVIFATGSTGIIWRHIRKHEPETLSKKELYLFGVVVHIIMVGILIFGLGQSAQTNLQRTIPSIFVVHPAATLLLGMLLIRRIQHKQLLQTVQKEKERFESLVNSMNDVVFTLDSQQRHNGIYGDWAQRFGTTPETFLGKTAREVLGEQGAIHEQHNARTLAGERITYEWNAGGARIQTSLSPMHDEDGQIIGIVGVGRDISDKSHQEKVLRETTWRLNTLIKVSPSAIIAVDQEDRVTLWNPAAEKIFGWKESEVIGKANPIVQSNKREEYLTAVNRLESGEILPPLEVQRQHKDGSLVWINVSTRVIREEDGTITGRMAIINDITERKRIENTLWESERKYQLIFENSGTANAIFDMDLRMVAQNGLSRTHLGSKPGEAIGKSVVELFGPERGPTISERMKRVLATGLGESFETEFNLPTGQLWFRSIYQPIFDENNTLHGLQIISQDITESKRYEQHIKQSLNEKETLLRELYHRTKNNMQVITSMLALQEEYLDDERVIQVLEEMRNRILSMALVHQKLYQAQNLSYLELDDYLRELANMLLASYSISENPVELELELENAPVLIDTAIPCGLILNELISNALKHAFPRQHQGKIKVTLNKVDDEYVLKVADNGVGLPNPFESEKNGKLGLQIITLLGKNQLQGDVSFASENGLTCTVRFPPGPYSQRIPSA